MEEACRTTKFRWICEWKKVDAVGLFDGNASDRCQLLFLFVGEIC